MAFTAKGEVSLKLASLFFYPMGADIKDDLFEHIDGLKSQWTKKKKHDK